jgi:hypothetical protein
LLRNTAAESLLKVREQVAAKAECQHKFGGIVEAGHEVMKKFIMPYKSHQGFCNMPFSMADVFSSFILINHKLNYQIRIKTGVT